MDVQTLSTQPAQLNYTFFRGTKAQLIGEDVPDPRETTFSVTVLKPKQGGSSGELEKVVIPCLGGTTLRNLLLGNGINVYRSLTRFTNCNGKQRCGTCIVEVSQ